MCKLLFIVTLLVISCGNSSFATQECVSLQEAITYYQKRLGKTLFKKIVSHGELPDNELIPQKYIIASRGITQEQVEAHLFLEGRLCCMQHDTRSSSVRLFFNGKKEVRLFRKEGAYLRLKTFTPYPGLLSGNSALKLWLDILKRNKLLDTFTQPNPYFREELEVYQRRYKGFFSDPKTTFLKTSEQQVFYTGPADSVLLFPDRHGHAEHIIIFQILLQHPSVSWVGLEMYPHTYQHYLDWYIFEPEDSMSYMVARRHLLEYGDFSGFKWYWTDRSGRPPIGEQNPYYKTLQHARKNKTRVIGLDTHPDYVERGGNDGERVAVRSNVWAKRIPSTGRGIIFGGMGHFHSSKQGFRSGTNFQDFLTSLYPERVVYYYDFDSQFTEPLPNNFSKSRTHYFKFVYLNQAE